VSPAALRISRRRLFGLFVGGVTGVWLGAELSRGGRANATEDVHWDYHEHGGAAGWGELTDPDTGAAAFPDCSLPHGSPVDIPRGAPVSGGLTLDYRPAKLVVVNNGHTVQVNYEPGSTMTVDGKTHALRQFHFHTPSEHLVHGRAADVEAHFVHQADDGELAVVGVLMHAGNSNPVLQQVLEVMPASEGTVHSSGSVDAAGLLPADLAHYAYDGSLTTPPCSRGVRWHVLRASISVSEDQVARLRSLPFLNHDGQFIGNARPVQPLNGRLSAPLPSRVREVTPPSTGSAGIR
jgi:carbonic anhydrase